MPRTARIAPGGMIFHVLNRANNRDQIFATPGDYLAFLRVLRDSLDKKPMRILSYCLMPNHWHLILWPRKDGELGEFLQTITTTHVRRWRLYRQSVGGGHLYQGTYKSFPVENDDHYYSVSRYVERNALRARLVERAEDWRWGSLWQRRQRIAADDYPPLHGWPLPIPRNWITLVNRPETQAELDALRTSVRRGRPFGSEAWQGRTAKRLGLESTFRPRGRPKKAAGT
jgi:putative transposase